ncbi:unnamed protein product [Lymnaea stagnalis]|uniref:Uncharacterized protein n=1 Tax=Lymnaea stagnalis TaxID=6523 RepID=A0AAV2GZZ7_LYMST
MENSTHPDFNAMESSEHHDLNARESSTHHDFDEMESSKNHDLNAIESSTHHDFNEMISSFPCLFNKTPLVVGQNIREIEFKLENELSEDNDSPEEIIAKLNFYTWVEFKLGNFPMANQYNQKVFSYLKARERPNITCLVNQAHILHRLGDDVQAEQCLAKAGELRSGCGGEKLMTEVDAELAYSLSRLIGAENLNRAIELYTEVVAKQPECYAWILRLGLLHRRATHRNVFSFLASNKSVIEHAEKAVELLYVVAQKSLDSNLRRRAYAQLAVLCSQSNRCFGQADCVRLFGGANVHYFIDNALNHGRNDAWTLTECGRIMRYIDLEKAISLLVQSLLIKNHSTTLHHLGMCYELNAKKIARRASKEERKYIRGSHKNTQSKNHCQPNPSKQSFSGFPGSSENETPWSPTIRSPVKSKKLNKGDPSVFLAIKCYCEAIVFSSDRNRAARFSLGLLLKECGEFEEALEHFDQIIDVTSKDNEESCERGCERPEYRDTLKAAHKQARLCLLELAKQPGKTEDDVKQLQERAEEKRLKAVGLEADVPGHESKRKRCK